MLASDAQNPQFAGAMNPDSVLHVTFYTRAIQNNWRSEKEGHPVFDDYDFVRIMTPGNQLNIVDTFVREEHRQRFPIQWAAYKNREGDKVMGLRVEEWPVLTKAQAEECKGVKFFTVEQIALASDQQIQALGMLGPTLRAKAK